jgi:hypothetical protein
MSRSLSFHCPKEKCSLVSTGRASFPVGEFGGKARPPLVTVPSIWRPWSYFCP